MRTNILGTCFDNLTMREAVNKALSLMRSEGSHYAVTPNSEIVYECLKDENVRKTVNNADMVLPDGIGVIYASKILKTPLKEKIAGIDFAKALMEEMRNEGMKLFLLGSKPGVAERASKNLQAAYPGLIICGTYDGYFKDDGPVIEKINNERPDALFVCLGAPKQELWMYRNRESVNSRLMVGLGGSLDVFSGDVKRAPDIFIKLGLEWFYRLIREPWRFSRMLRLPKFLFTVILNRKKGAVWPGN